MGLRVWGIIMFIKAKGSPSALVSISTFFWMPFGAHFIFAIGFLTIFFGVIVFAIPFISAVSSVKKCAHHLLLCSHHFATSHFVWNSFTFLEHSFCDHFLGGPELNWTDVDFICRTCSGCRAHSRDTKTAPVITIKALVYYISVPSIMVGLKRNL